MTKTISRKSSKNLRHKRVRNKVKGSEAKPRLCVFKSSKHIYAQIIDDVNGNTLACASSLTPKVKGEISAQGTNNIDIAKLVGKHVAELALNKGLKIVCFDRGGYPFHGRVKSLADGAREAGLEF